MRTAPVILIIALVVLAPAVAAADDWSDDSSREVSPGTYSGEISTDDDVDPLKLAVERGDVVTLDLSKTQGEGTMAEFRWPGGSSSIGQKDKASGTMRITAEESGYVYIRMTGYDVGSEPNDWQLSLSVSSGADQWSDQESREVSPGTYSGQVNTDDDTDPLELPVQKGDVVTLDLSKNQGEGTMAEFRWPGGSSSIGQKDKTSGTMRVTAEESGYVFVRMNGYDVGSEANDWGISFDVAEGADDWADQEYREVSTGTYSGKVNTDDDTDPLKIPVQQGDERTITLGKAQGEGTLAEIRWPGGSSSIGGKDTTSDSQHITVEETGYIYVRMTGYDVGSTANDWQLDAERGIQTTTAQTTATTTTTTTTPITTTTTLITTTTTTTATPTTATPTPTTTPTPTPETATPTPTPETPTPTPTPTPETATPTPTTTEFVTTTMADSDGDGVPDSEDYAPRDPDVQDESDLEGSSGSSPGFSTVTGLLAVVAALVLARRRST